MNEPTSKLTPRQGELVGMMRANGNLARFSSEERIKDWAALKKVMALLGGKWKSKPQAFEFDPDLPLDAMLAEVVTNREVPDPRAAGFFETPPDIADLLCERARINQTDIILEPSAGRGAIVRAIERRNGILSTRVVLCELLDRNRTDIVLMGYGDSLLPERSFLDVGPIKGITAVVMNPPFAKMADVAHVTRAIEFLSSGGRLTTIMSGRTWFREDRKTTAFRKLVGKQEDFCMTPLPEGTFKAAGTMVTTIMISLTATKRGVYAA